MNFYNKKNILFDFNLIFDASIDESYKTGLFWEEYNIVLEFIKNHSDKFNFYATCKCSKNFYENVVLNVFPEFNSITYFNIYSKRQYYKNNINAVLKKMKKNKNFLNKFKIICFKFLKLFIKFFSKKSPNINFIDIYQSFFYGIPKEILENKKIKKFIILNDILPYTNPEYYDDKPKNYNNIINNFYNKFISFYNEEITIFSISEFTMNEFRRNFPQFNNVNIIVNPLGANKEQYFKKEKENSDNKILEKYNIPTNKKYVLTLSSLNIRKNLAFLIDSFVEFLKQNPKINDLNLVIAGPNGWQMEKMFESIKNSNEFKDKIILTGFIDKNDINIIYNNAFVFVFPSLAEGFGLPVLEAMQCGLPVISSNKTSLPEVYGDAAIGFNPQKKEELIKSFEKFYFNESLRKELIEKGLKQSEKFTYKKTVDNIINEYLK